MQLSAVCFYVQNHVYTIYIQYNTYNKQTGHDVCVCVL